MSGPNRVELLVTVGGAYAPHSLTMIYSVLTRLSVPLRTHFISDASGAFIDDLEALHARFGSSVQTYRLPNMLSSFSQTKIHGNMSPDVYSRLLAHTILPTDIGRIIYLDVDLIARADIFELFKSDLGKAAIGATNCHAAVKRPDFRERFKDRYFNSGVMLLDLARMRSSAAFSVNAIASASKGELGPVVFHDQCVLNYLCPDWHNIGIYWNFSHQLGSRHSQKIGLSATEFEEISKNPGVFHFIGPRKPWDLSDDLANHFVQEWRNLGRECKTLLMPGPKRVD